MGVGVCVCSGWGHIEDRGWVRKVCVLKNMKDFLCLPHESAIHDYEYKFLPRPLFSAVPPPNHRFPIFASHAAAVHCTSKSNFLQQRWLLLVLWNIWNNEKFLVSFFPCFLPLLLWNEVKSHEAFWGDERLTEWKSWYFTLIAHSQAHTYTRNYYKMTWWSPFFSRFLSLISFIPPPPLSLSLHCYSDVTSDMFAAF